MAYSNKKMNEYMKHRYKQRRIEAIHYLGDVCSNCGSDNDLIFHHTNPETKAFTLARGSSFSDDLFWAEVDKCILLCSTCHGIEHQAQHPHGDVRRYWKGCRCDNCRLANREHSRAYKLRRLEHLNSDV